MQWKITVTPTDETLTRWSWTAESLDRSDWAAGAEGTHDFALSEAKKVVDDKAAKRRAIEEATTVEEYTPEGDEPPVEPDPDLGTVIIIDDEPVKVT